MNRRIEHITRLKADASKNFSEPFMVRIEMDVKINYSLKIASLKREY